MLQHLALFDPGWRDFSVRVSNTEVTVIWILAALSGALLYHLFFGRKGGVAAGNWQAKIQSLEKELHDERARQQRLKQQLDSANAKANSYASSMSELDKLKARILDLQKELESSKKSADRFKADYENEHSKVTSMIVDHSEGEGMKNRVKNQEKELARSREEIGRLRGELDAVKAERVRMSKALDESQVVEMRNRIQRLENDLQSSRLMVVKYQSDSARIEEETARLRKQEELVREMESLQGRYAKAEEELKSMRSKLTESASRMLEMEKLQASLNESEAKWVSHAERMSGAVARIASLEAELEALRKTASAGAAVAAPVVTAIVEPDDLKRIEGIGPKLEQILNEHGIHTFTQLKDTAVADLQAIMDKSGDAFRVHDPGTWPRQAGLLAEGRIDEFEALTARLKGGREVE